MAISFVAIPDIPSLKKIKPSLDDLTIKNRLKLQENGTAVFLILRDKDDPIGFVFLKWNGKPTHPEYPDMEDLYIREDMRGKGYGTKLIDECEQRAKEKGFKKIGLAVNPTENLIAKKLYEKLGYIHDGKKSYVDGVYNGVEDIATDLEKRLKL
ncbi:MAG: GNAT family N-acetyltransferase [Patescibacteria group bacterium]